MLQWYWNLELQMFWTLTSRFFSRPPVRQDKSALLHRLMKGHWYFRQAELRRICFAIIENPHDEKFRGRSLQTQMTERFVEISEIFWLRVAIITSLIWFQSHMSVYAGSFDVAVFWFCRLRPLVSNNSLVHDGRRGREAKTSFWADYHLLVCLCFGFLAHFSPLYFNTGYNIGFVAFKWNIL